MKFFIHPQRSCIPTEVMYPRRYAEWTAERQQKKCDNINDKHSSFIIINFSSFWYLFLVKFEF
jgi:hypothetical protein